MRTNNLPKKNKYTADIQITPDEQVASFNIQLMCDRYDLSSLKMSYGKKYMKISFKSKKPLDFRELNTLAMAIKRAYNKSLNIGKTTWTKHG